MTTHNFEFQTTKEESDRIKEAIEKFNGRKIPTWLKDQLNKEIADCHLFAEELRDNEDIDGAVLHERKANVLEWVLSLEESSCH